MLTLCWKLLYIFKNKHFKPAPFHATSRHVELVPGVAAGLSWTRTGGELLYVETSRVAGDGKITLTGQLGEVLQESVRIALSWICSHAELVKGNTKNDET